MTFSGTDKVCGLHQPQDHIHVVQCMLRNIDHVIAQLVFRLVDSRCIQEHDLASVIMVHRLDAVSRRLRLVGCDGNLLADDAVHQGRLAYIGTAYQCHKS